MDKIIKPSFSALTISRINIINHIYRFELMGEKLDIDKVFENSDNISPNELKKVEIISQKYDKFKMLISRRLSSKWTWERVSPYERSILLYGCFELAIKPKQVTINELVEIAKEFIPNDQYKFINAILQNVGDFYDEIKSKNKK